MRQFLRVGLKPQGYEVLEAPDGEASLRFLPKHPDLVILDLELTSIDGLRLLRKIRRRDARVPIIVVSNRADEVRTAEALDQGAVDFVNKPLVTDDLLARIRVAVRHWPRNDADRPIFQVGNLSVDLVRQLVKVPGKDVKLTPKERDLLGTLVRHAGKVLTYRFLLAELRDEATDVQTLRVRVSKLRQKVEADPERPQLILTETGIGYRLRAP